MSAMRVVNWNPTFKSIQICQDSVLKLLWIQDSWSSVIFVLAGIFVHCTSDWAVQV